MVYPIARKTTFPFVRLFIKSIEGLDNIPVDQPCVVASNHLGLLDSVFVGVPIVIKTKRRLRFLVDPKYKYWRYLGRFTKHWTNAIAIDHDNIQPFFEKVKKHIIQGDHIGIFPEGEVSRKPHLLKPKTGMIQIAKSTKAPIIPVGIHKTKLPIWKAVLFRLISPEGITIRIGSPITIPADTPREQYQVLADQVMEKISQLSGIPFPY
ncbi:MAG: lysophospholipid acyltransferase family protein [bacterium]